MKKTAFIAAIAAGLIGLAACSEQEVTVAPEAPEAGNTGFTIRATVDATKTSVDNYAVSWDEGDNMSILINNNPYQFTWTGKGDLFSSESFTPAAGVKYIWYALFPYDSHFTSLNDDYSSAYVNIPAKSGLVQAAPGDMSHLANMPLYGYAETEGEVIPEIKMHHLTSVIQLSIANNLSKDLDISSIGLDNNSGALLSGTFYVNCKSGEILKSDTQTQVYTYTDVTLRLTDGKVKAGETGVFYIPVAAAKIDPDKDLVFTITDNNKGKAVITKKLASGLKFNPGHYRKTSITIDADTEFEAPSQIEKVTVAEFLEKDVSSDVYYRLTGTVDNIINTTYGNFDLVDETGTVYVYGLTATKVNSNDKSFASLNIEEGDILTLEGVRDEHNNSAQVGGPAYFISVVKPVKFVVDPSALVFPADGGSLTATATATNFTGDVTISAVSDNSQFTATVSGTTITVTAPANTGSEEITGEITVTATGGNSTKTATIAVSQNKAAPVAQDGDILWQEDFTGYGTTMPATATDNHVFGGGTVSYALTGTSKLYTEARAGGVSPELLVSKSGGTFKISSIPTGSASAMTLTYRINNDNCSVSATNGVTLRDDTFEDNVKTVVFTVPEGVSSFDLELTNTITDQNCRVDNFVLVAGAPKVKETQTISFGDTKNVEWTVGTNCTLGTPKQGLTVTGAQTPVTYASSDPTVATVTNTGMVTPLKAGVVTITATAEETEDYKKATDSYTLTIVDLNAPVTVTKTVTEIVNGNSYTVSSGTNATCYTSFNLDSNISVSTSGEANCGSFWAQSSGSKNYEWRLYQNKKGDMTITAASGYTISSVNITFAVSNTGTLLNGSDTITSGSDITVNASSVTFTVGNSNAGTTNGQIKVRSISVTYK